MGTSCSGIFGEPCPTKPLFSKFAEYFIHQHMNELGVQIVLHLLSGVQEILGACRAPRGPKLLMARTWKSNLLAEAENWTQTGCLSERWSLVTAATFSSSQHSRSKSSLLKDLSPRVPSVNDFHTEGEVVVKLPDFFTRKMNTYEKRTRGSWLNNLKILRMSFMDGGSLGF